MPARIVLPEELVPHIKPGSFLEVELAPSHYIYVRKLEGLSGYVYYDYLTEVPEQGPEAVAQQPVLVTVSLLLLTDPTWRIVGWQALEANWPPAKKCWTVEPLPLTEVEAQNGVIKPNTEYFLLEGVGPETTYTPVHPDALRGLPRRTLYPPEVIEDKLRLHFGITLEGHPIEPLPLMQQPLW